MATWAGLIARMCPRMLVDLQSNGLLLANQNYSDSSEHGGWVSRREADPVDLPDKV